MSDPLVESFEDLKYPGSRHVRKAFREEDSTPEDTYEHDENTLAEVLASPRRIMVDGVEVEFYPISAVAKALNREVVTVRKWERKGYLPAARFRTRGKKQDRLYTRPQIEGLVLIAIDEGLMEPEKKKRINDTQFPQRAAALFEALDEA